MTWEYLAETFVDCPMGSNIGIVKPLSFEVNLTFHLSMRGNEGWELVQCGLSPGPSVLLIFKRPKAS